MKETKWKDDSKEHWVGLDVSKATFDAALAAPDQRFPSTPLRALPWKAFPRTREGVVAFLAWLDEQVPKRKARVVITSNALIAVLAETTPFWTKTLSRKRKAVFVTRPNSVGS